MAGPNNLEEKLQQHGNTVQMLRNSQIGAYVERGTARPAFKQALADQMAGFTGEPPPEFC